MRILRAHVPWRNHENYYDHNRDHHDPHTQFLWSLSMKKADHSVWYLGIALLVSSATIVRCHQQSDQPSKTESSVTKGFALCRTASSSNLVTKCDVGVQKISMIIDMDGDEARKFCSEAYKLEEIPDWKLEIMSPYSGTSPVAVCDLRAKTTQEIINDLDVEIRRLKK